jgi:hypothetical protein
MKKIFGGMLNFFGLRGYSTKETVYRIVNWITYAGLLISIFVWVWAVPNHRENMGWIILADVILAVPNLISWWGSCKGECREKETRKWRIMELVMNYGMIVVLLVSRVYLFDLGKEYLWDMIFCVLVFGTNAVSWYYRNKFGTQSW